MSPPLAPLSRIILFVKDVPALVAWYQKIFAFPPIGHASPDWSELQAGTCRIAFHHSDTNQAATGDPLVTLCFTVGDVPAAKSFFESRGATLGPVNDMGFLVLCEGFDPEGNRFQLCNR